MRYDRRTLHVRFSQLQWRRRCPNSTSFTYQLLFITCVVHVSMLLITQGEIEAFRQTRVLHSQYKFHKVLVLEKWRNDFAQRNSPEFSEYSSRHVQPKWQCKINSSHYPPFRTDLEKESRQWRWHDGGLVRKRNDTQWCHQQLYQLS